MTKVLFVRDATGRLLTITAIKKDIIIHNLSKCRDENGTRGANAETRKLGALMIKHKQYIRNELGAPAEIAESAENSHA